MFTYIKASKFRCFPLTVFSNIKQLIYIILFNEWLTITIILAKIIAIHFQQVELKVKKHWYRNKLQLLKSFLGMQKKCIRNNRQNIIDNNITSCKVWSVYKVDTFYCSSVVYRLCNLQLDVTPKMFEVFPSFGKVFFSQKPL